MIDRGKNLLEILFYSILGLIAVILVIKTQFKNATMTFERDSDIPLVVIHSDRIVLSERAVNYQVCFELGAEVTCKSVKDWLR